MYSLFRHVANHGYTRTEIEHKPLIETSAAIRIKAYKKLPELVEAVGKSVEISKGRVDLELESVLRRFNNDDITRF
jgi:hypothetical protein